MTLYEILGEIEHAIDKETGEVDVEKLNQAQLSAEEKLENIGCLIKNLSSDCDELKAEETRLKERRQSKENQVARLKEYLSWAMNTLNKTKFSSSKVEIGFRRSNVVETDEKFVEWAKLYRKDLLSYDEPKISKSAIKQAITDGEDIEFARIVEKNNLSVK